MCRVCFQNELISTTVIEVTILETGLGYPPPIFGFQYVHSISKPVLQRQKNSNLQKLPPVIDLYKKLTSFIGLYTYILL